MPEASNMPVHRRHGDVTGGARKALCGKHPTGCCSSRRSPLRPCSSSREPRLPRLLNGLQYVVVDELHSFIGTERGAQLQSLLHRVELALRRRVPRIGLSATLADLSVAAEFLPPRNSGAVLR